MNNNQGCQLPGNKTKQNSKAELDLVTPLGHMTADSPHPLSQVSGTQTMHSEESITFRSSLAKTTTLVVPSPTSSSWTLLMSGVRMEAEGGGGGRGGRGEKKGRGEGRMESGRRGKMGGRDRMGK